LETTHKENVVNITTASKITASIRLDDQDHFRAEDSDGSIMITKIDARFYPDGTGYYGGSGLMIKKDGTVGVKIRNAYTINADHVPTKIKAAMINAAILELQKWSLVK
jgi:hypothetical protein